MWGALFVASLRRVDVGRSRHGGCQAVETGRLVVGSCVLLQDRYMGRSLRASGAFLSCWCPLPRPRYSPLVAARRARWRVGV